MQLLLQLNAYFMQSTFAQIDALHVSCSSNHNALHKAKSRAKAFAGATHQQVTIQTL
jgi:imidazoleglycerol phosphate dehydratase HisB